MKKILLGIVVLIIIVIVVLLLFFKSDSINPYVETSWGKFKGECTSENLPEANYGKSFHGCDTSVPGDEIPTFKQIDFPFENVFDNKKSLPLMGSAAIDIDNDGIDEIFVSGGVTQEDALFKFQDNKLVEISSSWKVSQKPENTSTYGAVSFDLDSDGLTDLLLTGDYGLLWLKNKGDRFESEYIDVPLDDKSVAASITLGDINRDGFADIFVSAYIMLDKMEGQTIFKDFEYGGSSLMMLNNGDNTFRDATEELGLGYVHNTFMAVLVDVDNDGYLDLVVAHDTGEVRTYRNNEGNGFTMKANPLTGKYAYPMGIAVGDYNNDGNIDFFFSNIGTSVPHFLGRGDLAEEDTFISDWILFRNDGNFNFTDVAKETRVADFEFSWGAIFQDFNLDGRQDLVVAENYVDFPPHKLFKLPCRFLIQREDGSFSAVEQQANVINQNYAITPLSSDFNNDGYPDMVYTNLNGTSNAYLNIGGDANYIAFRFPENAKYAGAKVVLNNIDGSIQSDVYVIGEGLACDQSSTVVFGLGMNQSVASVAISLPDGSSITLDNPEINKTHTL